MDYRKIEFWKLALMAFLLNFVVQTIHETGHWIVLETMGRSPVWGFTQLMQIWGDQIPLHPGEWVTTISPSGGKGWLHLASSPGLTEFSIMLAAGPIFSVLGVIFGLVLMRRSRIQVSKQMGLVLALIGSLLMGLYYLRGFSRMSGDEYFLAANLGIPKYIIDIPLCLSFILAFILVMRALFDWKTRLKWVGAVFIGSIPAGLFFLKADGFVLAQVNNDNPVFRSIAGWSLPVLLINIVVFLALLYFWKRERFTSGLSGNNLTKEN